LPWPRIPRAGYSRMAASERRTVASAASQGVALPRDAVAGPRGHSDEARAGFRSYPLPPSGIDRPRAGSFRMKGSVGADAMPAACSGSKADLSGG
jgi:hypothetical protein